MALLALKVTTAVTPAGGSAAATTSVKSAAVTVAAPITLGVAQNFVLGPPGVGPQWKGIWSSGTTYAQGDGVTGSNGHNYISLVAGNLNHNPISDAVRWADTVPPSVVSDTSVEATSPVVPASAPRNRALRDFYSVLDFSGVDSTGASDSATALQTALGWASTRGTARGVPFKLVFPPGTYLSSSLIPKSYVDIWAHGALLNRNPADVSIKAFFYQSNNTFTGSPITQFAIRGAQCIGTGTETANQGFIWLESGSHITIEDCEASGVASFLHYFADCQYVWSDRNKVFNNSVQNALNFVNGNGGSSHPMKHIWARGNYVENCPAIGIALVTTTGANRTDPAMDAHLIDNTIIVNGGGWPIAVEQGGAGAAPNVSGIDISGGELRQNGTGSYALALTVDSSPLSSDPLCISDVTVRGVRIYSLQTGGTGIICCGSNVAISGCPIHATVDDILLRGVGGAVLHDHKIIGNPGQFGSGKHVNINPAATVDTTKLTVIP